MGKTSSEVKNRYNRKMYSQVNVSLPKQLVADWEAELLKQNISKAEFVRRAIVQFLEGAAE